MTSNSMTAEYSAVDTLLLVT